MAIVEAENSGAMVEAVTPFTPFFDFRVEPVVNVEEAVPIFTRRLTGATRSRRSRALK